MVTNSVMFTVMSFFLAVIMITFGLSVYATSEARKNRVGSIITTTPTIIGQQPTTFDIILNEPNIFSINQYIFIETLGTFVVNYIDGTITTVFNEEAVSDITLPAESKVYSAGSDLMTRATRQATVTAATTTIYVRDPRLLSVGMFISFQTTSNAFSMSVLNIETISEIESKLTLSNILDLGVGEIVPILSKVIITGETGLPGSSGGPGGVATLTTSTSYTTITPGVTTLVVQLDSVINLYSPRATGTIKQIVYFNVEIPTVTPNINLYFQLDSINTTLNTATLILDDSALNFPILPGPIDFNTIVGPLGLPMFWAGIDTLTLGNSAASLQTTTFPVNVALAVAPTVGQTLIATSATTATWQNIPTQDDAASLQTTGASVDVALSAPPTTDQVLRATSATT